MAGPCKNPLYRKCCILGLGLMGGSLGLALRKYNVVQECWGYDHDPRAMLEAREKGAVERTAELPRALKDAELVVLAMPVGQILETLGKLPPYLPEGALVTDLGSTKGEIVREMAKVLPPRLAAIGGHPMAGSEKAGVAAADPLMLQGALYLLTPVKSTSAAALQKMQETVRAVGARPLILGAEEHDRLVALVSHLPQLVAAALVNTLDRGTEEERELLLGLAGSGFKDTTRIAMGEPAVWYDIFATNRAFLKESLQSFRCELDALFADLEGGREKGAKEKLARAASLRRSLLR